MGLIPIDWYIEKLFLELPAKRTPAKGTPAKRTPAKRTPAKHSQVIGSIRENEIHFLDDCFQIHPNVCWLKVQYLKLILAPISYF
jgi:hypothetical protein